jgi:hypothetical protein
MIVHNKDGSTPVISGGVATANGASSKHFSAPQIYFFGGLGDGDSTPSATALDIAKLYDYRFGAQMTTFNWKEEAGKTASGALAGLPVPIVLVGQSFGGGAAVATAIDLGTKPIKFLDLFDPVSPNGRDFPFNIDYQGPPPTYDPGDTNSTFVLPSNVSKAYDAYGFQGTEVTYGNIPGVAPGPIVARRGVTNKSYDKPSGYTGSTAPTTPFLHVSQTWYPKILDSIVAPQLANHPSKNQWAF